MIKNDYFVEERSLSWEEVFSIWRASEAALPHWIEHYKQRGFNSWDEWRASSIQSFHAVSTLDWRLYRITDFLSMVPSFHGGPFRSWIEKYYTNRSLPTFRELAHNQAIQNSGVINLIMSNFPPVTTLIGISTDKGIVILEGMHRCCAVALAVQKDIKLASEIFIAIAEFKGNIPEMGQAISPAA